MNLRAAETNDVTFTPTYDGGARATRLATARDGTDIAAFNYSFDTASNITKKVLDHRASDPAEDYLQDSLYRLTHAIYSQRTVTQGFIYDDLGNRLTLTDNATTTSALYNSVNELTKLDATQVYYDKNGNLTKDASGNSYFYDGSNKLTRIDDSGSTRVASYAYDPFNRRIEKDVEDAGGDIITRFYYTNYWRLLEETDDAGTPNVQRYYVWGNYIDELLMMRDVIGTGGSANADYFAARDHLYGISALIDTSGGVVERYEYDAYGKPHFMDASYGSRSSSTYGNNILFDGYYYDVEGELYCVRNRIYDPATMRWLQRDPLGYVDGMNLHQYVASRCILSLDSTGLVSECLGGGWRPYHTGSNPVRKNGAHRFGVVGLNWNFDASYGVESCKKCCGPDTARSGEQVEDLRGTLSGSLSGSISGASYGGNTDIFGGIEASFWVGIQGTIGGSATVSLSGGSDRCNNRELSVRGCFDVGVYGSLAVGGEATVRVYRWWDFQIGLTGRAQIGTSIRACVSCNTVGCSLESLDYGDVKVDLTVEGCLSPFGCFSFGRSWTF